MKIKTLLLFCFLSVAFFSNAQMVVSDPALEKLAAKEAIERKANYAKTAKQLDEAYKHTEKLSKTNEFLKKNYDRLKKVNSYIRKLDRLNYAIRRNQSAIKNAKELVRDFETSDVFTAEEYKIINRVILDVVKSTGDVIEMMDLVLGPNSAMSDGERMQLLYQYERTLQERQTYLNGTINEYRSIQYRRTTQMVQQRISQRKN